MDAINASPPPAPRMRRVSANSRPQSGFADMQLQLEAGTATHLVDDGGEAMATPAALRNVLADTSVRALLGRHKPTILAGMAAEDTTGEGSTNPSSFRRIMHELQIGFQPHQVEDLVTSLLFLQQIGRDRGMPTPGGPELVPYSLLFTEAVSPLIEGEDEGNETDDQADEEPDSPFVPRTAPPLSARGDGPGMAAGAAAAVAAQEALGASDDDEEEDELPLPNTSSYDAARNKTVLPTVSAGPGRWFSVENPTDGRGSGKSVMSSGSGSSNGSGSVILKDGRTVSTAARQRAQASQRFRLPSVESLLDAAEPINMASVRGSVPELLASANVSVNLSAYSSIGVIAVFFASLSISVVMSLLTGSQHLTEMPIILTAAFITHAVVIVLNVFTVLTMSMVYYYGQLHIGHGFEETARHFVRNPMVKRLRLMALDAFWASAPVFMIAMGLTFLAQYTGPDGRPSSGAIAVSSVFGVGILVTVWAVLAVLRAHRTELHYHYHPEDRPKPKLVRNMKVRKESWEEEVRFLTDFGLFSTGFDFISDWFVFSTGFVLFPTDFVLCSTDFGLFSNDTGAD